jgi:hypothetical protein
MTSAENPTQINLFAHSAKALSEGVFNPDGIGGRETNRVKKSPLIVGRFAGSPAHEPRVRDLHKNNNQPVGARRGSTVGWRNATVSTPHVYREAFSASSSFADDGIFRVSLSPPQALLGSVTATTLARFLFPPDLAAKR